MLDGSESEEDMMLDSVAEASLLYDFYGNLLTENQNQVMRLYHEENLSLGEIAEERGISRQGVHDTLKKAEKALREYENRLGLVARFDSNRKSVDELAKLINEVSISDESADSKKMEQIKEILTEIDW
ncbi:hypothetical protein SAMN02910327_01539 [Peptostreptococcaceae bacterium pGA-8]|nr:hypothetical protein SAMN02910327_01539 [Peptostreptococcaceae bacterium pGA-8]